MSQAEITPEVQRFVAEYIASADQLDIMLLLYGSPAKDWTAREVSEAVFTVPASAIMRLEQLLESGFLVSTGGSEPRYSFRPATPELRESVDALAAAYRTNRVAVIQLVFGSTRDPLKAFSDAFRMKR